MSTEIAESVENSKVLPLIYKVIAKCPTTKARVGVMSLVHSDVDTPVFMPVGTQVRLSSIEEYIVSLLIN